MKRIPFNLRLRRFLRLPLVSPRLWARRMVFWVGAGLVAAVAVGFARAADAAGVLFARMLAISPFLPLIVAPPGFAVALWLTRRVFPGAQGSGIPQVIAALRLEDRAAIQQVLSLRIAAGKIGLTLLGLACGASIGREGPTVQVGAAIMNALGRSLRLPRPELERALILGGGAAGIAAAFNTPLAGVVFAIEELGRSFEARTGRTVLTCVVLAGIATLALAGNYTYFGATSATLDLGRGWVAVLICGVTGGVSGGLFSSVLVRASRGVPGAAGRFVFQQPMAFAALCGLGIALLGLVSGGQTYGTGYAQARLLVEGRDDLGAAYPLLKFLASLISYLSGVPGGIFAPSLSVGAGLGSWLAHLLPEAPAGAVVLLSMVAYFSGVVQAPLTATVIVMEMADNGPMTVPLMATAMLAWSVSRIVCRYPLYEALAERFLAAARR
jgi:H+/Cl- antiporter ClcA